MLPDDEIPEALVDDELIDDALIDDDTRVVDRARDDTSLVLDDPIDDTRVVDRESDHTRVVVRDTDDDTRLIRAPVQPHQPLTVTDSAARAALGSVVPNNGQLSGVSRPPDTPIGSTARYEVRAHGPAAPSIAREDFSADDPIAPLAATAGEIRRAAARRARRRSLASLGVVIGVSLVIAGAATAIILFIARM